MLPVRSENQLLGEPEIVYRHSRRNVAPTRLAAFTPPTRWRFRLFALFHRQVVFQAGRDHGVPIHSPGKECWFISSLGLLQKKLN